MASPLVRSPTMDTAKAVACTGGLDRLEGGVRPAKLFIGGITRHTTTKQLRDHFSRYGRVLDCVAMRQPDGRPRGFGYVTLDSPSAADRCLAEPQVIDGRVVDMKRAVPEGSGASPAAGALGQQPELCMGMRTPHSPLYAWPDSPGSFFGASPLAAGAFPDASSADHLWGWSGTPMHKTPGEVLDCVELLSRRAPVLQGREAPAPLTEPFSPASAEGATGRGFAGMAIGTLSASAPEFVPAAKASMPKCEPAVALKIMAPVPERPQRSPLGELTNITNIMNNGKKDGKDAIKAEPRRERPTPTPLAIGRVGGGASPMATPVGAESQAKVERRPMFLKEVSSMEIREDTDEEEEVNQNAVASESSGSDGGSEVENAENEVDDVDSPASSGAWTPGLQNLGPLPSVGSADHAKGTCKRCNFYPKGRCQNGAECTFCHFPHDKRKPSRQEKRDRRAARLSHREGSEGGALAVTDDQMRSLFSGDQENPDDSMEVDDTTQRTLAYTMLPGMPPIGSVKLPAPLALPGNGNYNTTGAGFPCLPPGLPPPQRSSLEVWQPDEEVSPLRLGLPSPATRPSPVLATVPMGPTTPQSVATSTPSAATTKEPSPEAVTPAALLASVSAKETCTIGTQTIEDLDHRQCTCCCCEAEQPSLDESGGEGQTATKAKSRAGKPRRGRTWLREELLRVREAMESSGALPARVKVRAPSTESI